MNNLFSSELYLQEQSAPATIPAGWLSLYPKTDDGLYTKTSGGVEVRLLTTNDADQLLLVKSSPTFAGLNLGAGTLTATNIQLSTTSSSWIHGGSITIGDNSDIVVDGSGGVSLNRVDSIIGYGDGTNGCTCIGLKQSGSYEHLYLSIVDDMYGIYLDSNLYQGQGFGTISLCADIVLLNLLSNESTDTDKFLVYNNNFGIRYRTGTQILSDIGALAVDGTAAKATILATGRNISITGTTGLTAAGISFNGSSDVTLTLNGTVNLSHGGTGASTAAGALTNLGLTATAAEINHLDGITATVTELNFCDGVTSNIQTQLNGKQAKFGLPGANTGYFLTGNLSGDVYWENGLEPQLGNPSVSGYVLSSTTTGVRSWINVGGNSLWMRASEGVLQPTTTTDTINMSGSITCGDISCPSLTTSGSITCSAGASFDNSYSTLVIDAVNHRVGVGTISPNCPFSVTPLQYSTGSAKQVGFIVTGVGTTFTQNMVGSQLVYSDGTNAGTITVWTSSTQITVSNSHTVQQQNFRICYTGLNIADNGYIGMGHSNPTVPLHINTSIGNIIGVSAGSYTTLMGQDNTGFYIFTNSSSRNLSLGVNGSRTNFVISTAGVVTVSSLSVSSSASFLCNINTTGRIVSNGYYVTRFLGIVASLPSSGIYGGDFCIVGSTPYMYSGSTWIQLT